MDTVLTSNHMDNPPGQTPATPFPAANKGPVVALTATLVLLLAVVGAIVWFFWPAGKMQTRQTDKPSAPVPTTTVVTIPGEATTTVSAVPSTGSPSAGTSTREDPTEHRKGEIVRLFRGDSIAIKEDGSPSITIDVLDFTDSRCPAGVQCIWAGERGVVLDVTKDATEGNASVILRTTTAKKGTAYGLVLTLIEIGDGKGGTYADIKVE